MKKITLSVAALTIAISSLAQTNDTTQCVWGNHVIAWLDKYVEGHGITKNNAKIECKNTIKAKNSRNCKNKTKDINKLCHLHRNE